MTTLNGVRKESVLPPDDLFLLEGASTEYREEKYVQFSLQIL